MDCYELFNVFEYLPLIDKLFIRNKVNDSEFTKAFNNHVWKRGNEICLDTEEQEEDIGDITGWGVYFYLKDIIGMYFYNATINFYVDRHRKISDYLKDNIKKVNFCHTLTIENSRKFFFKELYENIQNVHTLKIINCTDDNIDAYVKNVRKLIIIKDRQKYYDYIYKNNNNVDFDEIDDDDDDIDIDYIYKCIYKYEENDDNDDIDNDFDDIDNFDDINCIDDVNDYL
jgi:hypothetical protein